MELALRLIKVKDRLYWYNGNVPLIHEPPYVQDASIFIAGDHISDHRFPVILVEAEL